MEETYKTENGPEAEPPEEAENPPPPPSIFQSKEEFTSKMESTIHNIVNECISVLHRDPREYHPFYLLIYKFTTVGKQLGFIISEKEVDAQWRQFDSYAASQYKKWEESPQNFSELNINDYSPYLRYILTKKAIHQDQQITFNPKQIAKIKSKVHSDIDSIGRKFRRDITEAGITDQKIQEDLKLRLTFFHQVKKYSFPGFISMLNNNWSNILHGFTKHEWKDNQERLAKMREGMPPIEVKRTGRERRMPKHLEGNLLEQKPIPKKNPKETSKKKEVKEAVPYKPLPLDMVVQKMGVELTKQLEQQQPKVIKVKIMKRPVKPLTEPHEKLTINSTSSSSCPIKRKREPEKGKEPKTETERSREKKTKNFIPEESKKLHNKPKIKDLSTRLKINGKTKPKPNIANKKKENLTATATKEDEEKEKKNLLLAMKIF